jgi:hypothetical protein
VFIDFAEEIMLQVMTAENKARPDIEGTSETPSGPKGPAGFL